MPEKILRIVSLLGVAVLAMVPPLMGQSPATRGLPVTYERLLKATEEPGNWLTYGGDYRSHHYSSLKEITVDNVHRLRAKWIYQMHRPKVEATPIVVDGVMYLTRPPSDVIALDAETGRALWTFEYRLAASVYHVAVRSIGDSRSLARPFSLQRWTRSSSRLTRVPAACSGRRISPIPASITRLPAPRWQSKIR